MCWAKDVFSDTSKASVWVAAYEYALNEGGVDSGLGSEYWITQVFCVYLLNQSALFLNYMS